MAYSSAIQTIIDKLSAGYYTNTVYNASTNPGGMKKGGHKSNFPQALLEVAQVADAVGDASDNAGTSADAAADSAATASAAAASVVLATTSATSNTIGTGAKSFAMAAAVPFGVGQPLRVMRNGYETTHYMFGTVSAVVGTALTVDVTAVVGSGDYSDWVIVLTGATGAQGPSGNDGVDAELGGSALSDIDMAGFKLTVDLVSVGSAGEAKISAATATAGEADVVVTGAPIITDTLAEDRVYNIGGPWTPGHQWSVEIQPTQDAIGGRNVTFQTLSVLTKSADTSDTALDSGWSRANVSLSAEGAIGPSGWYVDISASGTGSHYIQARRSGAVDTADKATAAVLVKPATSSKVRVEYRMDTHSHGGYVDVELYGGTVIGTGTIASGTLDDHGVIDCGGDWSVIYLTIDVTRHDVTDMILAIYPLDASGNTSYAATTESVRYGGACAYPRGSYVGFQNVVGTDRSAGFAWHNSANPIVWTGQAGTTASAVVVSAQADGSIIVADASKI